MPVKTDEVNPSSLKVSIFPNPVSENELMIQFKEWQGSAQIALFDLQGKQPGEAPPVAQRGHVGFVKHFNSHAVLGQGTGFHQRRVTDQRLPALMDFKQFGQLAKRPLGVGLGGVDLRAARAILAIFRINFTCFYY